MKESNIYYTFWLFAVVFLLFTISACKRSPETTKIPFEYAKQIEFPKFDTLVFGVYTISEKSRITSADCEKMLKNLSEIAATDYIGKKKETEKNENKIWYESPKDPSSIVHFNLTNGDFTFNTGMAKYAELKTTPDLVKSDKAVEIAQSYIKKLKIQINDEELTVAHIGGVNSGSFANGKSDVYEKFTTVRFERKLDGIPVFGHSRIVIQMAEKGKLNSIISQWTPLNKTFVKTAELIKSEELKPLIEKSILAENTKAQKIYIESVKIVYYDKGSGIIEPAVLVQGRTFMREKSVDGKPITKEYPYDTVIPLLKSPKLKYPFNHKALEKRPYEKDTIDPKQEARKSDDDLKKK